MLPLFTVDTQFANYEPNANNSKGSVSSEDTGNGNSSSTSGMMVFLWFLS